MFWRLIIVCMIAGICLVQVLGQDQANTNYRLGKVSFVGLKRIDEKQVAAATGLQPGQSVNIEGVKAAAGRLMGTGFFAKVLYRYRSNADVLDVTFEVEEVRTVPCVFDNFVWFSQQEILDEIKVELNSFDGSLPESGTSILVVRKVLERMLQDKKIAGQVDYLFSEGSLSKARPEHIFSIKDPGPKVCSLHLVGVKGVLEAELRSVTKPLLESDYSYIYSREFAPSNFNPIYRKHGFLRAAFRDPQAELDSGGKCKNGVKLTLTIDEGLAYNWEQSEWSNNQVLSSSELISLLGMKAGELANGEKMDEGLKAILKAYGRRGYIAVRFKPRPEFDDASRKVTFKFAVEEGPQFRMGELTLLNISDADARKFREAWKVKTGDVYDDGYLVDFLKDTLDGLRIRVPKSGWHIETKPDLTNKTVSLSINFVPNDAGRK